MEIRTARLILRRPHPGDAEAIFKAYASDPRVSLYMSWLPHRREGETRRFVAHLLEAWLDGGHRAWIITLRGQDRAIGSIGFTAEGPMASIGYVLGRVYWSQGYVSEALTAVLPELGRAGLRRAYAVYDTENPASGRVMAKAGMKFWGRLPKAILHPAQGRAPRDVFLYEKGL